MTKRNRTTRGFTLVEVLLVIAILGVLAGVFAFTVGGRLGKSKVDTAGLLIEQISSKLGEYSIDIGHYPSEDEGGLKALVTEPTFDDESLNGKWAGPYINSKQLKDPWGHELSYQLVDKEQGNRTRQEVQVWSHGPNGEDDSGEGDDVKSWEDEDAGR
jgi:general secretion pathway protein G